jgi:hypothetical protein
MVWRERTKRRKMAATPVPMAEVLGVEVRKVVHWGPAHGGPCTREVAGGQGGPGAHACFEGAGCGQPLHNRDCLYADFERVHEEIVACKQSRPRSLCADWRAHTQPTPQVEEQLTWEIR